MKKNQDFGNREDATGINMPLCAVTFSRSTVTSVWSFFRTTLFFDRLTICDNRADSGPNDRLILRNERDRKTLVET